MSRDGWEVLPSDQALRHFDRVDHLMRFPLRQLLADSHLTRSDLRNLPDHDVLDLVRKGIRCGGLAVLRPGSPKASKESQDLRRLLAQINKQTRGRLTYGGRQHILVLGDDLGGFPARNAYEVVPEAEAQAILDQVSRDKADLQDLLAKAKERLSKDWRPPFSSPNGLVLLRRMPVQASRHNDEGPALTPSQIKQLLAQEKEEIIDWTLWIELDPEDPKAEDDTVILLDAGYEEVERTPLSGCPRSGSGVLVIFKQVEKHSRYTLIRDYGPDEGGGQDTLFIDRSPAELEEECKRSS